MNVGIVPLVSIPVLALGYFVYGRYLARRVFGVAADRPTPAVRVNDGRDFVPTHSAVLFGHHFATIAGAGPIVGPTLAVVYGWGPAWLWIIFGAVFMGAVHDFAAIFVSAREGGTSLAEVVRAYLGPVGYLLFMGFLTIMLALVTAAFLNLSAVSLTSTLSLHDLKAGAGQTLLLTRWKAGKTWPASVAPDGALTWTSEWEEALAPHQRAYPRVVAAEGRDALAEAAAYEGEAAGLIVAVPARDTQGLPAARATVVERHGVIGGIAGTSVIVITAIAPLLGWLLVRRRLHIAAAFALAAGVCLLSIAAGIVLPVQIGPTAWKACIAVYTLFAAGIPVWVFLQPRDFINVQILYAGILLLAAAVMAAGLQGAQMSGAGQIPAWSPGSAESEAFGPMFPLLFITVACGAISGFHAIVAGGTTSKQLSSEPAALRIGYGGMLLESLFAVLVMVAVCGALGASEYLRDVHPLAGGGNPPLAFAHAVGNLVSRAFHVAPSWGCIAGIVLIGGFAATTLDSAVRLQRYLFEELWRFVFRGRVPRVLGHTMTNSALAVGLMLLLAFSGGVNALWKLFGTANQLLAAMALLTVSVWLLYHGRRMLAALVPACLMLVMTVTALVLLLARHFTTVEGVSQFNTVLFTAEVFLLGLAAGMVIYAARFFARHLRGDTHQAPPA